MSTMLATVVLSAEWKRFTWSTRANRRTVVDDGVAVTVAVVAVVVASVVAGVIVSVDVDGGVVVGDDIGDGGWSFVGGHVAKVSISSFKCMLLCGRVQRPNVSLCARVFV